MRIRLWIRSNRYLLIILSFGLTVRLATALWLGDTMEVLSAGGTHDQVSYDMLAHRLATGHGFTFPTAWYPWVEPDTPTSYYSGTMVAHLALIYYLFGYHPLIPRILYALLGTGICLFLYRLGKRLFGESVGLAAALLGSGYAYLILYSATLLTETPFIFFLLATLDQGYELTREPTRYRWITLGLSMAGTILFRMAVLPFVLVLLCWASYRIRASLNWKKVANIMIPIGIMIAAVLPWTVRNYLLYDRFMLLESQFGHVFWNSNHPDRGSVFDQVDWIAPIPDELADLNEADLTSELLRRGIRHVVENPGTFIRLTLSRFRLFFMFWPSSDASLLSNVGRVLSFGVSLPFMLYGLILSFKRWQVCLPLYLFVVAHLGVYLVSWVMIRYRVPADTVLLIFAGLALVDLARRISPRLPSWEETA